MTIDGILVGKIVQQLQPFLPCKINKIQQVSEHQFLFHLRTSQKNKVLTFCLHPNFYYFSFTTHSYNTYEQASNFLMVLRKHCNQGVITKINQVNGDRIVKFTIQTLNVLKEKVEKYIYLEFLGKYANLVIVDENNKIIDALKKTTITSNHCILPKLQYPIIDNGKKDFLLSYSNDELDNYNGISKKMKQFLEKNSIIEKHQLIVASKNIYIDEDNNFHTIPLDNQKKYLEKPILEAFDYLVFHHSQNKTLNLAKNKIRNFCKRELKKLTTKIKKLESSIFEASEKEKFLEYGDLLYANESVIEKDSVISVRNFENTKDILIPIDLKFSIKENAKNYYKKYRKLKKGEQIMAQQKQLAIEKMQYYEQILDQLEYGNDHDAFEIAQELNIEKRRSNKAKVNKQLNYMHIRYENVDIYVGKNNLQNDYVTNTIGKKHYIWFHVKDYHGAHVVVNQSEVNEEILRLCAMLAAYHSKARYSSSIGVNYCLLKNMKKTSLSQLGLVYLGNYKTIYIDIDEDYLFNIINKYQVK